MQKKFYVSATQDGAAPSFNRFSRIDQLNELISQGWVIKQYFNNSEGEFFLIEKN